jgi:hypothetical protein
MAHEIRVLPVRGVAAAVGFATTDNELRRPATATVPVLYLHLGVSADLADRAVRLLQIIREFEVISRTTPAASTK